MRRTGGLPMHLYGHSDQALIEINALVTAGDGGALMALVITTCTNRKRKPISRALHISDLNAAPLFAVATSWCERLSAASERFPASAIYGGRAFQEAAAAAREMDARLLVVSAGLGLVDASCKVPPYACTVLVGAGDSVADRVTNSFNIQAWWNALRSASPFAAPLTDFVAGDDGPILAALSDAYLSMIADEMIALPPAVLSRLRIFTRTPANRITESLHPLVMPYDDRLDGPDSGLRGTRSDFASRALRHFVALDRGGSAADDAQAVEAALAGWRMPPKFDRARHDDLELLSMIRRHWDAAHGSSSKLLRFFRDELGVACEQSRFATLARQVRGERS